MPLRTRQEIVFDAKRILHTDIVVGERLADCKKARAVCLVIQNSLNANVSARALGGTTSSPGMTVPITLSTLCTANAMESINIGVDNWMPYIGVEIQALATPTSGRVIVTAYIQEEV